jgi:hypothetical protein
MVELKVVKVGRKVHLSPHQVAFHLKHASLGCPTWIMVQYHPPMTRVQEADIRLYRGDQAEDLFLNGIDATPVVAWPVNEVDWPEVERLLQSD